jgi:hypothetical protein
MVELTPGAHSLRLAHEMPKNILKCSNPVQLVTSFSVPINIFHHHWIPAILWLVFIPKATQKYSQRMFIKLSSFMLNTHRENSKGYQSQEHLGQQVDSLPIRKHKFSLRNELNTHG